MPRPSKLMRKIKGMRAKSTDVRPIYSHDENLDVQEQWDLRSCMHPGMVDQTDNGLGVEEEWNLLQTERSNDEDEESDGGDRFDNINDEKLSLAYVRRAFDHCLRFMSGYSVGLTGTVPEYAVKKCKSHRRIEDEYLEGKNASGL